jgi:hypothetical protein
VVFNERLFEGQPTGGGGRTAERGTSADGWPSPRVGGCGARSNKPVRQSEKEPRFGGTSQGFGENPQENGERRTK